MISHLRLLAAPVFISFFFDGYAYWTNWGLAGLCVQYIYLSQSFVEVAPSDSIYWFIINLLRYVWRHYQSRNTAAKQHYNPGVSRPDLPILQYDTIRYRRIWEVRYGTPPENSAGPQQFSKTGQTATVGKDPAPNPSFQTWTHNHYRFSHRKTSQGR